MTKLKTLTAIIGACATLALLAGCSSSGGGGGDSMEKFCKTFDSINSIDQTDADAMATWMGDLADNAPSAELKDDLTYLMKAYQLLSGVEYGDTAAIEEALASVDKERLDQIDAEMPSRLSEICDPPAADNPEE